MTSPSASPASGPLIGAWQRALDCEHAAVYGYGELGPKLADAAAQALARTCEAEHRALRDATSATIAGLGATPDASQVTYPPPFPLPDVAAAQRFALRLEEDCAAAWRYLIAAAAEVAPAANSGTARQAGQDALTASALRALAWRSRITPSAPTVAFPGIEDGGI